MKNWTSKSLFAFILHFMMISMITGQINLQGRIARLDMNGKTDAIFSITYGKSMHTTTYNHLINIGYVQQYDPQNGMNISSKCLKEFQTKTSIKCEIVINNKNINSLVYITYFASSHQNLFVGNFQYTINLNGLNTIQQSMISYSFEADKQFFKFANPSLVQSMIFVSGISSVDSDFRMDIQAMKVDFDSSTLLFFVKIQEIHAAKIEITFGFIIYDPIHISINLYQKLSISPDKIQDGMLYGITSINKNNSVSLNANSLSTRRLQTMTIPPSRSTIVKENISTIKVPIKSNEPIKPATIITNRTITSSLASLSKINQYVGASVDYPINIQKKYYNFSKKQILKPSFDQTRSILPNTANLNVNVNVYEPSRLVTMLRNPSNKQQFTIKSVDLNPQIFNQASDPDGILDSASPVFLNLISKGLFTKSSATKTSVQSIRSSQAVQSEDSYFNKLFSTNGFIISATSTQLDPIYYFQVSPVQELPGGNTNENQFRIASIKKSIYFQSIATHQPPLYPRCQNGILNSYFKKVDLIQKKAIINCLPCPANHVVNSARNGCIPQEIYLNPNTINPTLILSLEQIKLNNPTLYNLLMMQGQN